MFAEEKLIHLVLTIAISYLLGSMPTAYIVARLKNVNIFEVGSGNMGGTNVIRALGPGWGVLTAVIDGSKGMIAILIAWAVLVQPGVSSKASATTIAALVTIVGHNWSLFATLLTATFRNGKLRATLRGGKGAATTFGTLLMIAPAQIILAMLIIGGLIVALTRYVSLGVLTAFGVALIWLLVLTGQQALQPEFTIYSIIAGLLMLHRFRGNIQRLLTGTERRLGERA